MGTEIVLLRHGQSQGNLQGRFGGHSDTPLTALGIAQAEATARALDAEGGLTAIFCSDLPRTIDTAKPICEHTGIAMVKTPALRERSVGLFTGLTFAEAESRYPEVYRSIMTRQPGSKAPEGETHGECTERAGTVVDEALARFPAGRILFVSHSITIQLLLKKLLGLDETSATFRIDNCGLHRLLRNAAGHWTVEALNDRRHLVGVG